MSSRNPRDIIIRPVVSEKSYAAYDANVYTFLVAPDANKIEIKQAVEAIFSVKVTNVNTVNRKGKGFSGVMKRHNFHGGGASHGNHKKHRSPGAIGACATPARVFKGMGMPGQHGNSRVTTLNLEVVEGDPERGLLLLRGSVPGPSGSVVFVRDAVKADAGRERAHQ